MKELLGLLKKGSESALWASVMNAVIAIIKAVVFFITGNVAMFAEMMHSIGDTANQAFVFVGSSLSKKAPTDRFPNGFARLVNLVLLGSVLIVGILAFETIKKGIDQIMDPFTSGSWFWLNIGVLGVAAILESIVLFKAMKEIVDDSGDDVKGFSIVTKSLKNIGNAKPATKLVFLEDSVATAGAIIAILSIIISTYTSFHAAEGYASIIIGVMLFFVVGRIFLDNAAGVLGVSDEGTEEKIGELVFAEPNVKDIQNLMVIKEGEELHVELKIELDPDMTVAEADDVHDKIEKIILDERGVTEVLIEFDEDDNYQNWSGPNTDV